MERRVAATTQQQAFNALLFLYRYILLVSIEGLADTIRARRTQRLPVVLTPREVQPLIDELRTPYNLMAGLIYASGLRLNECMNLRVRDLDFERQTITVRSGKGDKDRATLPPPACVRRCSDTFMMSNDSMPRTAGNIGPMSLCPSLWRENTRTPLSSGHGIGFFPPGVFLWFHAAARSIDITCIPQPCKNTYMRLYQSSE